MKNYTNRELITAALAREHIDRIPKFMVGMAYVLAHSGVDPSLCMREPETFVKVSIAFAEKYGLSIHYAGAMMDVTAQLAKGLTDREGKESATGEETIRCIEDINKLRRYSVEKSMMLNGTAKKISLFKQHDPETPTMAVIHNTAMVVSELMGAATYYKALLRKKEFVRELSEYVEPMMFQGLEKLAESGCDIIWLPMPTMGGTCISKKMYLESCHEYSARFVKKVHALGMKAIIHTCGNWNDRFDVVMKEGADGIHLSEAVLTEFAEKYGQEVCMLGNISVVNTLLYKNEEEVYKDAYQACLDACKYGNYIMAPDCGTPASISEANVAAMYKAANDATRELFSK